MIRTLVFPSCNEPGLEVIHALTKSNKIVVYGASSINPEFDPSKVILENHWMCPYLSDPNFERDLRHFIASHDIDVVFPTEDSLVAEFSKWNLKRTTFITPNSETALALLSKSKTYEMLRNVVPTPDVYSINDRVVFPAYAKPDRGAGSKGHMLVSNASELELARSRNLLITEFLPGDEFTVDCINDLNGNNLFFNVRVRGLIGRGISLGTKNIVCGPIEQCIRAISDTIRIEGPWFGQFKLAKDKTPKLLEINARIGGASALTRLGGVNIPLISVFLFKGYPISIPKIMKEVTLRRCLRNFGDIDGFKWVVWDFDDTLLRKDRKVDPDVVVRVYDFHNQGIQQILISKNPDIKELVRFYKIPNLFEEIRHTEDKSIEMECFLEQFGIEEGQCLMVNDSISEKLLLEKKFPKLRIITPDALDSIRRERIQ